MNNKFYILFIAIIISINPVNIFASMKTPLPVEITTSPEDTEYLREIMKKAFDSIYYYRNPATGLVTDFPEKPDPNEGQKTENNFLMLTSMAIAGKTGCIPEEQAIKEIDKILSSIEKMERRQGFFWGMYHPSDATPYKAFTIYSAADFGAVYNALATVGEVYPEFKKRTEKILKEVHWKLMYDSKYKTLYGAINFESDNVTPQWACNNIEGDIRSFVFICIAAGGAPPEIWNKMGKYYLERYGVKYLKPGEAMGYGEQPMYIGYFMDERGSSYGMSCANMGWGQINYAADLEFPTWGWSSCLDMDGYLAWGTDTRKIWSRVNTHAVAAQVIYYPNQVVKAFKAMEKLGIRKPIISESGKQMNFGLRDSIDVDTYETPEILLPGLDQNIVFLSLANYLYDGIVWKYFLQNKMVQHGISVIEEYNNPKKEYLEIYKKRDLEGPKLPPKKDPKPEKIIIDDFTKDKNLLGGERNAYNSTLTIQDNKAKVVFTEKSERLSHLIENLNGVNLTDYNALKLVIRGEKQGKVIVNLHITGEGGYLPVYVNNDWTEVTIPFRSFMLGKDQFDFGSADPQMNWTAMWHNRSHGDSLEIGPISLQAVELKKISFLSLSAEEIHSAALHLREIPETILAKDGTLDNMDDLNNWKKLDTGSKASISIKEGLHGKVVALSFRLPDNGGWAVISRELNLKIDQKDYIVFNFKAEGGPARLEVKLIDSSGANFIKILSDEVKDSDWHEIKVKCSELNYGWGGIKKDRIDKAVQFQFSISSNDTAKGCAYFDDLKIVNP